MRFPFHCACMQDWNGEVRLLGSGAVEGAVQGRTALDYYNFDLSLWEPLQEAQTMGLRVERQMETRASGSTHGRTKFTLTHSDILNINLSPCLWLYTMRTTEYISGLTAEDVVGLPDCCARPGLSGRVRVSDVAVRGVALAHRPGPRPLPYGPYHTNMDLQIDLLIYLRK